MLLEKLAQLEQESRKLAPSTSERQVLNQKIIDYSNSFVDEIDNRPAYVISSTDGAEIKDYPIQEEGRSLDEILDLLELAVHTPGLNPASGGHLGYIPGGGVVTTAMGDYMADIFNRYAGIFYGSPGAVRMENLLIRWMCSLMGYPETALGNLTSGGSIANLIAITTARDKKGITSKKVDQAVIYLTEQVHHCVQKAIRIAGLNEAKIEYIPMDELYRMDATALQTQVEKDQANGLIPFLVVGSIGTTDVGAVDPINSIATIAEKNNMWFHIDAAYGGFFILVDECKEKFEGIERSDSIAIDPHKGLFLSYGTGAVLIKDVKAQLESHYYKANYMQDAVVREEELSPADLSPELTKHFRGLRMWLPLQVHGLQPFRACLEEKIYLCRYFYEEIRKRGFETGPYPELSVMLWRFVPQNGDANAYNEALLNAVKKDGRVFVSSTTLNGIFWIRLAVLSFRTHKHTIDILLEVVDGFEKE